MSFPCYLRKPKAKCPLLSQGAEGESLFWMAPLAQSLV